MSTSTNTSKAKRASGWSGRLTPDEFADLVAAGVKAGIDPLIRRIKALEGRPAEREKLTRDYSVEAPARAAALGARVAALEARSAAGVTWAGVYENGRSYAEGSLCTRKGGLWLALRETAAVPGTVPAAWRLVVKEGEAHDR